jgi:ribosome maturation factor RimP
MAGDRRADRYALGRSVIALLEDELADEGYELVDVRIFRGGGRDQVRVYLDTPAGIDLASCARASRTIEHLLDEAELFPGPYVLEVSSPGVRRPLRTAAHFQAAIGEDVELKLRGEKGAVALRGRLRAVEDDALVVSERGDGAAAIGPTGTDITAADAEGDAAVEDAEGAENTGNVAGETRRIPRRSVLEANLDPEFDAQALIGADRRRRKAAKRQRKQERRAKRGKQSGSDRSID